MSIKATPSWKNSGGMFFQDGGKRKDALAPFPKYEVLVFYLQSFFTIISAALTRGYPAGDAVSNGCVPI